MRITKHGHSCLLVEDDGARLLLDPGTLSHGWTEVDGVTAVLVTHQHPDHVDVERLPQLLRRNPEAAVYADVATAGQLRERGLDVVAVEPGDHLDLGVDVHVLGGEHAVIHPDIPVIPNNAYLVAERLLHPGDSLLVPPAPVEVLALPAAAPWLKVAEAVDYLRAVRPAVAVPIHEAVAAFPAMYYQRFLDLAPEGTEVRVLDDADPLER